MRPSQTLAALLVLACAATPAAAATYYLTVAGLGDEPDYAQRFAGLAHDLERTVKASDGDARVYTLAGSEATRTHLSEVLHTIAGQASTEDVLIVTLIGHGSDDGAQYKINLPGPDMSASELAALCNRVPARRQLIVNTTSASGGSILALRRPGRAVITATKSGTEKNATVFARYWLEALQDPTADVDKNSAISALEAFQYATAKTAAFYTAEKRLATEHAVFEDTGSQDAVRAPSVEHGEGRLLASLTLLRLGDAQRAASSPDKLALLSRRDQLEQAIDLLKYQRAALDPRQYKQRLTDALLELARLQQQLDP